MNTRKNPFPKEFDTAKYSSTIDNLSSHIDEITFEKSCALIAFDILKVYERFERIEIAPSIQGRPFDFFGFKDGKPYIIELKASLDNFNAPGGVQISRMQKVLDAIDGLNIALLQLKLSKGQYRIFYNEQMDVLFKGKQVPIEPVIEWVRKKCEN
jgi:hypothetical protein